MANLLPAGPSGLQFMGSSCGRFTNTFDLRHELWDTEEEEEEEEEGSCSEASSADLEESFCEECRECAGGWQDPALRRPWQWHPQERWHCGRRLSAPYGLPDKGPSQGCAGHRWGSGAEIKPWGRRSPPLDPPLGPWVQDTEAVGPRNCCLEQAPAVSGRTLSHPSFQTLFAAVSACSPACPASPGGQRSLPPGEGPLPLVDCSTFFYTDPLMPPGCRIYNRLSTTSQKALQSLQLNTPAPIMCTGLAPPSPRWLSDLECGALSGLLALPAAGDASPCPSTVDCEDTGAPAPCHEACWQPIGSLAQGLRIADGKDLPRGGQVLHVRREAERSRKETLAG